jgi:RND family efflux transporter MFP subunit
LGIDANNAYTSVLQAKKSLESAKASEKQAEYDLDHNHSGLAIKKILENKRKSSKIALDAAGKDVSVAEAQYQSALDDANKRKVVSPINGTVNAVNIKNGDDLSRISSGNNSLAPMIIGDLATLKTQVAVNEVDISNVSAGQKATLTFNGIDGLTSTGKVEKVDSLGTISQGVVTYNVTISFDTLDSRIKSDMSVSASIITGVKQDVVIVPNSAVKTQGNNNYVEVLNSGSTPQQVTVQVGAVNNTDTEIVSGINVGDNVVTRTINPGAAITTGTSGQGGGGQGGGGGGLRIPGVGGGGGGFGR